MMNYFQKKKLAFMSIVNKVKGFIRTITGVLPLTLEGCVDEESIIDYTLYGQSVQNGTPTPETPIEVESVGDKTRNLFNPSKLTGGTLVEYNGIKCFRYTDNATNFTYTDNFKENTRYTFSIRLFFEGEGKNTSIVFHYTDGTYSSLNIRKYNTVYSFTSASDKTITKITGDFYWSITRYIDLTVTQLEEGTTATAYEPYGYKIPITASSNGKTVTTNIYLDEPLRKVGDYADYIDFEKGKVVRNVGKYTFTGNETDVGGADNDTACVGYVVHISGLSLTNYKRGLCKHAPVYTETSKRGISRLAFLPVANHPYCYVFFKKTDFPDLTAKQIIKQMYDSGNPLVLYYNRNTPRETLITLPNIPTFRGTSTLNADTTIQPSNAEVTYYSNVKE